jgi:hypothetical protein
MRLRRRPPRNRKSACLARISARPQHSVYPAVSHNDNHRRSEQERHRVRQTRCGTSRHCVARVMPPREIAGYRVQGTSRSIPALGPTYRTICRREPRRPVIAGPPAPAHAQIAPGSEAVDGQDNWFRGFWEIGAPGIICPGRGTRASANTSGPDFTCGLWTPVKLRTVVRTERRKLVSSAGPFAKERTLRKRSSRLT